MRVLRGRLPPRGARRRRQGRLDQPRARRARQRGTHVPQGPLRPPVLDAARPPDDAADPRGGRRRFAAGERGTRRSTGSPAELGTGSRPSTAANAIARSRLLRATDEDCYAMQRLMRGRSGPTTSTPARASVDSADVVRMRKSLGLSGATGSFSDFDHADATVIIGANPTEGHPVVGARIKQAVLRGMRLVTIDPRRIELAEYGDAAPRASSGDERRRDARDGPRDRARWLLRPRRSSRRARRGSTRSASCSGPTRPTSSRRSAGCPPRTSRRRRTSTREAEDACLSWGLGVTEHKYGSEVVRLICNVALMTGKIGRLGSALMPLRGQNNVQGSSDMGALPDTFTAYRSVDDEDVARSFEDAYGVSVPREKGYKVPEMFDAAVAGDLKAMYIFGEDVAQTDPDTAPRRARRSSALEFLVCQDIFETETTKLRRRDPAGLVLPREAGHVHQRRAPAAARRAGDRSARRGDDGLRDHRRGCRGRSATRPAGTTPRMRCARSQR